MEGGNRFRIAAADGVASSALVTGILLLLFPTAKAFPVVVVVAVALV